ncbi:MAG: Gfo/Idh/MocA family oxidoreductase [Chloroflexota bacterium]|nr:MAG: Gfo/Idh/MocA family oxidoreductase [Chloroflexota bacterium]
MSQPVLRVGIVGANYGRMQHIPAYRALPEIDLVAICTAHRETAEKAAARHDIPRAFAGYEELAASPDVDLIDVVTRPSLHYPMSMAALLAGKHVLCEAPLALDTRQGDEMVRASRRLVAVVNMQSRYAPGLEYLRQLVADGYLGRVEAIRATAFQSSFAQPEKMLSYAWGADREHGASALRVYGLHTADIVRWCFGEISAVCGTAVTQRSAWELPGGPVSVTSQDNAAFVFRLTNGAIGTLQSCWNAWHGDGWRLEAYGSEGRLVAATVGHTPHEPVRLAGARREDQALRELNPPAELFDVPEVPADAPYYAFARFVRRLTRSIADGTPIGPTFADGLRMLQLAAAVEESHESGRWCTLAEGDAKDPEGDC